MELKDTLDMLEEFSWSYEEALKVSNSVATKCG